MWMWVWPVEVEVEVKLKPRKRDDDRRVVGVARACHFQGRACFDCKLGKFEEGATAGASHKWEGTRDHVISFSPTNLLSLILSPERSRET